MAKGGKAKSSVNNDIEACRHETDKQKNTLPGRPVSYVTSKPKPKKYEYDLHLDPQFIWMGEKEHTSFEVPTVSLHIHERIALGAGIKN